MRDNVSKCSKGQPASQADAVDGAQVEIRIAQSGGSYFLTRLINGRIHESYRPLSREEASVAAIALIQGFQPPRDLRPCGGPAG